MVRRATILAALLAGAVLGIGGAAARIAPASSPAESSSGRPTGWYARVDTSLGTFVMRLLPEQAPQTVAHFVGFARGTIQYVDPFTGNPKKDPFYDGVKIHRVTQAQRFEAGDWTGTGRGAPPFWVPREQGPVDFSRPYRVGMTASSMQKISGVLFFVSMVSEPYLNMAHNCFGEVIEGREVVDKICNVRVDANKVPVEPVTIQKVEIFSVGDPAPIPEPVRFRPPIPVPQPRETEFP